MKIEGEYREFKIHVDNLGILIGKYFKEGEIFKTITADTPPELHEKINKWYETSSGKMNKAPAIPFFTNEGRLGKITAIAEVTNWSTYCWMEVESRRIKDKIDGCFIFDESRYEKLKTLLNVQTAADKAITDFLLIDCPRITLDFLRKNGLAE